MAAPLFRLSKRPNAAIVFARVIYRYIFPHFSNNRLPIFKKKKKKKERRRGKRFSYLLCAKIGNKRGIRTRIAEGREGGGGKRQFYALEKQVKFITSRFKVEKAAASASYLAIR